ADDHPLPRRLAAALRLRALHMGAGRHLVRAEALFRLLHVRHGEGVRAALPLRPAHAPRLEGVPADLDIHGRRHSRFPQDHGICLMGGMWTGALIGLAMGIVGFVAMRALARRVELPETKTALNLASIVDLALLPVL